MLCFVYSEFLLLGSSFKPIENSNFIRSSTSSLLKVILQLKLLQLLWERKVRSIKYSHILVHNCNCTVILSKCLNLKCEVLSVTLKQVNTRLSVTTSCVTFSSVIFLYLFASNNSLQYLIKISVLTVIFPKYRTYCTEHVRIYQF